MGRGSAGFGFLVNVARQEIVNPQIVSVIVPMVVISFIIDRIMVAALQAFYRRMTAMRDPATSIA